MATLLELFVDNVTTTLNGGINAGQTTLVVASATGFPTTGNFRLQIGTEIMLVTGMSGTTATVTRGAEGTTAATHADGDAVSLGFTKGAVQQAISQASGFATTNCRLTLTSGTAVTTADVTAATNVYVTPYKGTCMCLYTGGEWVTVPFSEITVAVPSNTNTPFDVFAYVSAGAATAEAVAWTNTTTRATALTTQDGILAKTGATDRKYLGTCCTTAVSGQCEDSYTSRFVWNWYNQEARSLKKNVSASHTYNSATVRAYNNAATSKMMLVVGGLSSLFLPVNCFGQCWNYGTVGIGLDSTSAYFDATFGLTYSGTTADMQGGFGFPVLVPIGQHTINLNENGSAVPANFLNAGINACYMG